MVAKNVQPGLYTRARSFKARSSVVRLSEVVAEGRERLEATAYGLERRAAMSAVLASPNGWRYLNDHETPVIISKPVRVRRVVVDSDHGVGLLTSSDIIDVNPHPKQYISRKLTSQLGKMIVRPYEVLVTRSGTVGNVALATRRIGGLAVSEHVLRVASSTATEAGFLAAFLRGRFGRSQLTKAAYGSVVVHIEPEHLEKVITPAVSVGTRTRIGHRMVRATDLRADANQLLDDASAALSRELSIPVLTQVVDYRGERAIVRLSDLRGRFDATYHKSSVYVLESWLRNSRLDIRTVGNAPVGEVRAVTKFRKRVYSRKGIPLYSSKQVFQIDPINTKYLAKGAHLKDLSEIQLEEGMTVVSCSGTIGRVIMASGCMAGWAVSQHALRVIPAPRINPGYVYAWLASSYGQLLMKRHSYGSVIVHIDREMLASVPIPILSQAKMNRIGDLVLAAAELRDEAWSLEKQAITEVERLVLFAERH